MRNNLSGDLDWHDTLLILSSSVGDVSTSENVLENLLNWFEITSWVLVGDLPVLVHVDLSLGGQAV